MRLAQDRMNDRDPTTFVSSDHGFAPQFAAIDASKVLVDLGLLSRPQTSNCRPATGETIGKAKACFAGGAVQIYLNLAGREPPAAASRRSRPTRKRPRWLASRPPSSRSRTQRLDRDGQPEGWKVIDRVFTKAEARYIPNGAARPPTWRTRRAPATSWRSRTRRTSSTRRRPAR